MDLSKNNRFSAEEVIKMVWVFVLLHASIFIMETEDNSIQRQLYDSSII